jgi:hypothetical protein
VTLREADKSQLREAIADILTLSPGAVVRCNSTPVRRADEFLSALERASPPDQPTLDLIVSQLGAVANVLKLSSVQPPRMDLAWLSVDTSPASHLYVDFEWRDRVRSSLQNVPLCGSDSPAEATYPCRPVHWQGLLLIARFGPRLAWTNGAALVTAPNDRRYNCLSWTLGETECEIWPSRPLSIQALDQEYAKHGIVRDTNGHIAAWGHSDADIRHVSLLNMPTGKMESKLGAAFRALHLVPPRAPEKASYGVILHHYRYVIGPQESRRRYLAQAEALLAKHRLTEKQAAALAGEVGRVASDLARAFEGAYAAWRERWVFVDDVTVAAMSDSDPYAATRTEEFGKLVALGPEIVPLLMQRVRDEPRALLVVERLLPPDASVEREPGDPEFLNERTRAAQTLQKWAAAL